MITPLFNGHFTERLFMYIIFKTKPKHKGFLGGLAAGIAGGLFASHQANKNRDFQAYHSANAHQIEVEDLKKAGLNPILSATGGSGASTPSGAMAQLPDLAGSINSAVAAKKTKKDIDLVEEQVKIANTEADIKKEKLEQEKLNTRRQNADFLAQYSRSSGMGGILSNLKPGLFRTGAIGLLNLLGMKNANQNSAGGLKSPASTPPNVNSGKVEKTVQDVMRESEVFKDDSLMDAVYEWLLKGRIEPIQTVIPPKSKYPKSKRYKTVPKGSTKYKHYNPERVPGSRLMYERFP